MTALLTTPSKFCQSLCHTNLSPLFSAPPCPVQQIEFAAYISMTPCELEHRGDLRVESGVFSPASYCIFPASRSSLLNHIFCQTGLFSPAPLLTRFCELYFVSLLLHPQGENGSFSVVDCRCLTILSFLILAYVSLLFCCWFVFNFQVFIFRPCHVGS